MTFYVIPSPSRALSSLQTRENYYHESAECVSFIFIHLLHLFIYIFSYASNKIINRRSKNRKKGKHYRKIPRQLFSIKKNDELFQFTFFSFFALFIYFFFFVLLFSSLFFCFCFNFGFCFARFVLMSGTISVTIVSHATCSCVQRFVVIVM